MDMIGYVRQIDWMKWIERKTHIQGNVHEIPGFGKRPPFNVLSHTPGWSCHAAVSAAT